MRKHMGNNSERSIMSSVLPSLNITLLSIDCEVTLGQQPNTPKKVKDLHCLNFL